MSSARRAPPYQVHHASAGDTAPAVMLFCSADSCSLNVLTPPARVCVVHVRVHCVRSNQQLAAVALDGTCMHDHDFDNEHV